MHRTLRRTLLLVAAVLLAVPGVVAAQAQTAIAGVARDTTGAVMPGVTVEVSSPAIIEGTRTTVTDGNGQYRVVDLRPGTYTVVFTLNRPFTSFPINLRVPINYKSPYTQQWSFDIQRQIAKDFVLTAGYVGSKGTHLLGVIDINSVPPGAAAAAGIVAASGYINATVVNRLNALRPYRGWSKMAT